MKEYPGLPLTEPAAADRPGLGLALSLGSHAPVATEFSNPNFLICQRDWKHHTCVVLFPERLPSDPKFIGKQWRVRINQIIPPTLVSFDILYLKKVLMPESSPTLESWQTDWAHFTRFRLCDTAAIRVLSLKWSSMVGKSYWRRKWQLTPVFLPGKLHRSHALKFILERSVLLLTCTSPSHRMANTFLGPPPPSHGNCYPETGIWGPLNPVYAQSHPLPFSCFSSWAALGSS